MRTLHETVIQGRSYTMPQLGAVEGRRAFLKLFRGLGPILADLFKMLPTDVSFEGKSDEEKKALIQKIVIDKLQSDGGDIIERVIDALDDATIENLLTVFAREAMVQGDTPDSSLPLREPRAQEIAWSGGAGIAASFQFLVWAAKVNFADFLDVLPKRKQAANASGEQAGG